MRLRQIRTKSYEKSFKKLYKSGLLNINKLNSIVDKITTNQKLPPNCKDHKLHGDLKDFRECHISPDILLIYEIKKEELVLVLARIGSHSDLFS